MIYFVPLILLFQIQQYLCIRQIIIFCILCNSIELQDILFFNNSYMLKILRIMKLLTFNFYLYNFFSVFKLSIHSICKCCNR